MPKNHLEYIDDLWWSDSIPESAASSKEYNYCYEKSLLAEAEKLSPNIILDYVIDHLENEQYDLLLIDLLKIVNNKI